MFNLVVYTELTAAYFISFMHRCLFDLTILANVLEINRRSSLSLSPTDLYSLFQIFRMRLSHPSYLSE